MRLIQVLKSSIKLLFFILILILSYSCIEEKKNDNLKEPSHSEWNYGEFGPERWADLEEGRDCGGHHQSPVNIVELEAIPKNIVNEIEEIRYNKVDTIKSISNNGHTIQYNFNGDDNIIFHQGEEYKMIQFHFHSPSEHTINGVRYPLEVHAVHHSQKSNSFVVFAALVMEGEPDATFTFLEKYLPIEVGETKEVNTIYSFGSTLNELFGMDSIDVYSYNGSLTTPPCTEKVFWVVMKNVNSASAEQIEILKKLMPLNNYREVQPLNGREIYREMLTD